MLVYIDTEEGQKYFPIKKDIKFTNEVGDPNIEVYFFKKNYYSEAFKKFEEIYSKYKIVNKSIKYFIYDVVFDSYTESQLFNDKYTPGRIPFEQLIYDKDFTNSTSTFLYYVDNKDVIEYAFKGYDPEYIKFTDDMSDPNINTSYFNRVDLVYSEQFNKFKTIYDLNVYKPSFTTYEITVKCLDPSTGNYNRDYLKIFETDELKK